MPNIAIIYYAIIIVYFILYILLLNTLLTALYPQCSQGHLEAGVVMDVTSLLLLKPSVLLQCIGKYLHCDHRLSAIDHRLSTPLERLETIHYLKGGWYQR